MKKEIHTHFCMNWCLSIYKWFKNHHCVLHFHFQFSCYKFGQVKALLIVPNTVAWGFHWIQHKQMNITFYNFTQGHEIKDRQETTREKKWITLSKVVYFTVIKWNARKLTSPSKLFITVNNLWYDSTPSFIYHCMHYGYTLWHPDTWMKFIPHTETLSLSLSFCLCVCVCV